MKSTMPFPSPRRSPGCVSSADFPADRPKLCLRTTVLAGVILVFLAGSIRAQTLVDSGSAAPKPGTIDLAQLISTGNQTFPDGLNYFTDNQPGYADGEPGQTFTTGTNSAGYLLTSVAMMTAGLGVDGGVGTLQPYYLHLYSVSGGEVTPLQTLTSGNVAFKDGDWLQWSGLAWPLAANATYAWSFGKASSTAGWEALAVAEANLFPGGEIGLFPPAGGAALFGGSHAFDAVFDLGLTPVLAPIINSPTVSPTNSVFSGTLVTFTASVDASTRLY